MDGTKNLMVSRSEKSVWDKPSLTTSLSAYDQERWLMATWGSALVMVGRTAGRFCRWADGDPRQHPGDSRGDGPPRSARRAALARPHARRARVVRQGCRLRRLRGVVPGQRLALLDRRVRRHTAALGLLLSSGTPNRDSPRGHPTGTVRPGDTQPGQSPGTPNVECPRIPSSAMAGIGVC